MLKLRGGVAARSDCCVYCRHRLRHLHPIAARTGGSAADAISRCDTQLGCDLQYSAQCATVSDHRLVFQLRPPRVGGPHMQLQDVV